MVCWHFLELNKIEAIEGESTQRRNQPQRKNSDISDKAIGSKANLYNQKDVLSSSLVDLIHKYNCKFTLCRTYCKMLIGTIDFGPCVK